MTKPLLVLRNHHTADCGEPPSFPSDNADVYLGYFENALGEQWVFTFDRQMQRGELRGGDAGWHNEFAMTNGVAEGVVLSAPEADWLRNCWSAATACP